ncbi:hypothetical protein Lser_V15G07096 [Lactuca serriola]
MGTDLKDEEISRSFLAAVILLDLFFKYHTIPKFIYHEGEYFQVKLREINPITSSQEPKEALGMTDNAPPPWFINIHRYFTTTSLDEAYLDITKFCKERDLSGGKVTEELRENVYKATGLTCSAGVAPNRLLAKVFSDKNKPNRQFVLPNDCVAIMTFISSLPIRKIGGIGKVTEHILKVVFEIKTCEDLLQKNSLLFARFSPSSASAELFVSVGLGLGGTEAPNVRSRKSIHGKTLTLKLKAASFEVRT